MAGTSKKSEANKEQKVSVKKLRVTQIGSPIGRIEKQEATLRGLGLNKRHRSRLLDDTAAVRGMLEVVKHLVTVEAA